MAWTLFVFLAIFPLATASDSPDFPWYNWSIPIPDRVRLLVDAMQLPEKIGQLNNDAPAVDRVGLPAYNYWSEAAHGVAWAGRATVFPASIGMAASFDVAALNRVGLGFLLFLTLVLLSHRKGAQSATII
jgi:beta-glucosidase